MQADRKDLVHHLFALATEIVEAAHEAAASGQAPAMTPDELIRAADALDRHGSDLRAIARAIMIAAGDHEAQTCPETSS